MASEHWDAYDLKQLDAGGLINEDVMQRIWDISAIPLPFSDRVGRDTARNQYTEWTEDELNDPDLSNAVVSGSDATGNDARGGKRVGNHCQNSVKVVSVTERARGVDTIGRADEFSYQLLMRQRDLRRDLEAIAISNQASVEDNNNDTPGKTGGFSAWLTTNTDVGATGSNGGFNTTTKLVDAPTAGEARALSFATIKDVIESTFRSNGEPTVLMAVPGVIRRLNEFLLADSASTGYRAKPTANVQGSGGRVDQTAQGFINVLVTDFGFTLEMVPNRIQQTYPSGDTTPVDVSDVFMVDPEFVAMAFLKPIVTHPLGKQGLADRSQISTDWTIKVYLEKAHGVIRDIDPTLAVVA